MKKRKANSTDGSRYYVLKGLVILSVVFASSFHGVVKVKSSTDKSIGPLFFDWDVRPTSFNVFYERQEVPSGCEFCGPITIQGIRSGYTGGVYGVDANGDGVRDGSLTADFELVSEVAPAAGGQYLYTWESRNLGTGAVVAFLGSGPDFGISADDPLLGTAGPDRLVGTFDDLSAGQTTLQTFIGGSPRIDKCGGILNPSTGTEALLYGPTSNPPILATLIDIKPGSFPNSINPKFPGKIPIAILTTDTFDAASVDPETARFGPTGIEAAPVKSALADVDGDGDTDLVLHFSAGATGIACGHTTAIVTAETFSGQEIQGFDSIVTVGCN